jgi:hypothetical protein
MINLICYPVPYCLMVLSLLPVATMGLSGSHNGVPPITTTTTITTKARQHHHHQQQQQMTLGRDCIKYIYQVTRSTNTTTDESYDMVDDIKNDDWDPPIDYESNQNAIRCWHLPGSVECFAFSPDGTHLVCSARGTRYLSL